MTGMTPTGSTSSLVLSLLHPMLTSASPGSSSAIRLAPHGRRAGWAPARVAGREPERKQRLMDRGAAWWNACAAARLHRTSEAVIEPREIAMAV